MADGFAHPAELEFRAELARLLASTDEVATLLEEAPSTDSVRIEGPAALPPSEYDHGFFQAHEHHYSRDPARMSEQLQGDLALLDRVERVWANQRREGTGRLRGVLRPESLPEGARFLDGHVYVHRVPAGQPYELLVLGDLHGCYSVLKAAIMQARFFEKVDAYRREPGRHPLPLLVLLGDYIDRGLFSINGVLRTVLQLVAAAPDHVYALRGNHEYYVEVNGTIYGGVKPSEAINTLRPHVPMDVFRRYMAFFEGMPTSLLLDRSYFVHAGIPRDRTLKERYVDLSSLNDPDIRFQMMWSDPSAADVVPAELQEKSARFPFGRLQAKAFLQRVGATVLVRGHEKVNEGFHVHYDEPGMKVVTLFSAGGADNADLPGDSSYRSVTPMALTVKSDGEQVSLTPWAPDYRSYNDPARNAFFRVPPEIQHRAEGSKPQRSRCPGVGLGPGLGPRRAPWVAQRAAAQQRKPVL